jgi:hypothetical protein
LAGRQREPGRLNAFAVLAFCAEITRLPGHWSPRSLPDIATTCTTPSRSTMRRPHLQAEAAVLSFTISRSAAVTVA